MEFPALRRLFRLAGRPPSVEQEVDQEIAFHLEEEARGLAAGGRSLEAARAEAERRFGDLRSTRAELARLDRERRMQQHRAGWFADLGHDLAYALRGLRRQPGFAALVAVTLGLGVGANVTMFGIVDRMLLRPPAFLRDPGRTGRIYTHRTSQDGEVRIDNQVSFRRYTDLRAKSRTLVRTAVFYNDQARVVGAGESARQVGVTLASASFWGMFDARPAAGRFFTEEEDVAPRGAAVAVLGHGYWQTAYGGDLAALGNRLHIGPREYTIIGVAPRGFSGTSLGQVAAFIPITTGAFDDFGDRYATTYNLSWVEILATRQPDATPEATDADLTLSYQQSRTGEPSLPAAAIARSRAQLAPIQLARGPEPSDDSRVALWLGGVALVVLVIASANVANLLLARSLRRRREIAVRLALGAGRRRLLRQLLAESTLLAGLGGAAGLLFAATVGVILQRTLLSEVDWSAASLLDLRMVGFALAVTLVASLLTGLLPAFHAGRTDLVGSLKEGGREGGRSRTRLRSGLLVAQSALSVVLLIGAGLFIRSLRNATSVDLGYDPSRLIVVNTDLRGERLVSGARGDLQRRLLERARTIPGVERATATFGIPFWRSNSTDLFVPGRDSLSRLGTFYQNIVAEDYFDATGTTLLRGRVLTLADRSSGARVTLVSEMLASKVWPDRNPIGQCLKVGADTMPCAEVVGIVKDVRWGSLGEEDRMQFYDPMPLDEPGSLLLRVTGDPRRLIEPVRRELQGLLPGLGYVDVRSLDSSLDHVFRPWRLGATMFTLFGILALVVSAVGLYGTIAYSVTQRSHEMGVRAALGARPGDLLRLVAGEGLRVTFAGMVLGGVAALAAGRFLSSLLFGVAPADPGTFALVAVVLLLVTGIASLVPAWRASRADPSAALRSD